MFDLNAHGYAVVATLENKQHHCLATARLRGPGNIVCDLLFASSGIEREVTERATTIEIASGLTLPVSRVEELLALKVLSATPARPLDAVDFVRLIEFNPGFDEQSVRANLELIERRGYHREQDLLLKFENMLRLR